MQPESSLDILKQYTERTKQILDLSSPQLTGIRNSEDYRRILTESFARIGELAQENNHALNVHFYPLIHALGRLSAEQVQMLRDFGASLADVISMESLDLPLVHMQALRILQEAEEQGDARELVLALNDIVISSYMMLNLTLRLYPDYDLCFSYRDCGLAAAERLLTYLEPEQFALLPDDECKEIVLINSRYIRALFEWDDRDDREAVNESDLVLMRRALSLADQSFYRGAAPQYDWNIHVFRTLQYLADFTEFHNHHGFNEEQLDEIAEYTNQLAFFLQLHPELSVGCPEHELAFYRLRNTFLTGGITKEQYQEGLRHVIQLRDAHDYSARSMFFNLVVPYEYILTLDGHADTEEEQQTVRGIYSEMAQYAYHMPKSGVLSFMVTFLAEVLQHYIEVPGGIRFEEMCLKLLAAMHPPTYVHTLSVADFSIFLTAHLLSRRPDLFIGVCGLRDAASAQEKRQEILDFIRNAALMHDIGKLLIIETIITYGRDLPKEEIALIRTHPVTGASLLRKYASTEPYAEFALGHHRWYDGSGGYPESFEMTCPENHALLSILTVADCLDAATDSIGRSYKKGKTLTECVEELKAESGTRYAPYVVEMLEDAEVRNGLRRIIEINRQENYRQTFLTLKEL